MFVGRIYKLSSGDLHYIGSTQKTLAERLWRHRSYSKRTKTRKPSSYVLYQTGKPVTIQLLEEKTFQSSEDLRKCEQWHIENNECVNVRGSYYSKEKYNEYQKLYQRMYRKRNKVIPPSAQLTVKS
jgi:hypothetical protein